MVGLVGVVVRVNENMLR